MLVEISRGISAVGFLPRALRISLRLNDQILVRLIVFEGTTIWRYIAEFAQIAISALVRSKNGLLGRSLDFILLQICHVEDYCCLWLYDRF